MQFPRDISVNFVGDSMLLAWSSIRKAISHHHSDIYSFSRDFIRVLPRPWGIEGSEWL